MTDHFTQTLKLQHPNQQSTRNPLLWKLKVSENTSELSRNMISWHMHSIHTWSHSTFSLLEAELHLKRPHMSQL